jgi:putative PIN family toxin of toxin-antitoxin system
MVPAQPIRAVIDTNVVLDWLVFGDATVRGLGEAIASHRWVWHASARMLSELRSVLERSLPERWEAARKHALTIDVAAWTTSCAEPAGALPGGLVCRDPDDQMFIDLAVRCSPSWLLTRDRALLALRRRALAVGVVIAAPAQWQRVADPAQAAAASA